MESFFRNTVDLQNMYNNGTNSFTTGGDAHYFEDLITPSKIKQYLDSTQESDKLKGMKLLLAMISKGKDIPEFFPDVVKNVVVKSIEVKKMVYIYLVHYADFDSNCREIALLSINSFQKDMSDSNPLIRGLALRVLTSIRVEDIIQIQLLAIRKCATDNSPYVRKCAANAIPKIYYMDPLQLEHLKSLIETLLKDNSTMVLGSTVAAFNEVCPISYNLLHSNYRKLCHLLADMDEWTQVSILEVMTRYVRNQFTDPAPEIITTLRLRSKQRSTSAVKGKLNNHHHNNNVASIGNTDKQQVQVGVKSRSRVVKKAFYSDDEDESEDDQDEYHNNNNNNNNNNTLKPEFGSVFTNSEVDYDCNLDPDHRLILKSSLPLLKSRNAGVVLGVSTLHYYCGTQGTKVMLQIGKALIRILRNRREVQYVVLNCIRTMSSERPDMFKYYLRDFFMKSSDPVINKLIKLDILASLSDEDNIPLLLKELQIYIGDNNEKFVAHSVKTIGRITDTIGVDSSVIASCMEGIMQLLIFNKTCSVIGECAIVLRQLFQQNPLFHRNTMILRQLLKLLIVEGEGITEPSARVSIIWLVGEFYSLVSDVAPDVLRCLALSFVEESTEVKMQILNLATKLSLQLPEDTKIQALATYVLELTRYDLDTDLRDRSRVMTAFMGLAPSPDAAVTKTTSTGEGQYNNSDDEDALAVLSEHAIGIVLAGKLPPVTLNSYVDVDDDDDVSAVFMLGSLSSIVAHNVNGFEPLSKWQEVQADSSKRDAVDRSSCGGYGNDGFSYVSNSNTKGIIDRKDVNLRDFYKEGGESDHRLGSNGNIDSSDSGSMDSSSDNEQGTEESATSSSDNSSKKTSSSSDNDDDTSSSNSSNSSSEINKSSTIRKNQLKSYKVMSSMSLSKAKVTNNLINKSSQNTSSIPAIEDEIIASKALTNTTITATNSRIRKAESKSQQRNLIHSDNVGLDLLINNDSYHHIQSTTTTTTSSSDIFNNSHMNLSNIPLIPNNISSILQASSSISDHTNLISSLMDGSGVGYTNHNTNNYIETSIIPTTNNNNKMNMNNNLNMYGNNTIMNTLLNQNTATTIQRSIINNNINNTNNLILPTNTAITPSNNIQSNEYLSSPKQILKPEMGGGLDISLVFRRNNVLLTTTNTTTTQSSDSNMFQAYLIIKNCRDHNIRRVRISFPAMDQMHKGTMIPEIPLIPFSTTTTNSSNSSIGSNVIKNQNMSNQIILPIEVALSYRNVCKQFKVDIRSDLGVFNGSLCLEDWDFIKPLQVSMIEFETQRAVLGGFGEHTRIYPITSLVSIINNNTITTNNNNNSNSTIEQQVLLQAQCALHMYVVRGTGYGELMLAGCIKKGIMESKVYLTLLCDSNEIKVRFNCEDPVFCSKLSDWFHKLLII